MKIVMFVFSVLGLRLLVGISWVIVVLMKVVLVGLKNW